MLGETLSLRIIWPIEHDVTSIPVLVAEANSAWLGVKQVNKQRFLTNGRMISRQICKMSSSSNHMFSK
jgi:hypothetical protein